MSENCVFDLAWVGPCGREARGDPPICSAHRAEKCWCGAQAVRQCDIASSFVCGYPLCAEHGCKNVCGGLTGSPGHKHSEKGRAQWLEWTKERPDAG